MRILRIIVAVSLLISVGMAAPLAACAEEPQTRILLVGRDKDEHPPETHEYMPVCALLAKCLRQTPGVETVVSNGWPSDEQASGRIDSVVVYAPWGANVLFEGPQRQRVEQVLNEGAGLAALHWGTGAVGPQIGELYLRYLGGWFHTDFSQVKHVECDLKQVDAAHPICRGWQDYRLFDEFYFNLRFDPSAHPLMTVEDEGRTQVIGWTFERPGAGGGRSFGFDGGHYHKNFGNETFRRAVINGILWTAHREVPAEGAPCVLAAEDLALPAAAGK